MVFQFGSDDYTKVFPILSLPCVNLRKISDMGNNKIRYIMVFMIIELF
jgi:hypothetical protein